MAAERKADGWVKCVTEEKRHRSLFACKGIKTQRGKQWPSSVHRTAVHQRAGRTCHVFSQLPPQTDRKSQQDYRLVFQDRVSLTLLLIYLFKRFLFAVMKIKYVIMIDKLIPWHSSFSQLSHLSRGLVDIHQHAPLISVTDNCYFFHMISQYRYCQVKSKPYLHSSTHSSHKWLPYLYFWFLLLTSDLLDLPIFAIIL